MAEQLLLVHRYDFTAGTASSVSLINSSGIELSENGWQPQVIPAGQDEVTESMTFVVNGTSTNALATAVQAIYQKARECEWSKDPAEQRYVFIMDQLYDESNARKAVVKSIEFTPGASLHDYYPVRNSHAWKGAQIGLVRGHWENQAETQVSPAAVSCLGGAGSIGTLGGDVSGRLARIMFLEDTGNFSEVWWGFKSTRNGNVDIDSYVTPWDTDAVGTPTLGSDTTIASGYYVTTFATSSSMVERFNFLTTNITATQYNQLRGCYRMLGRAKVNAGTARVMIGGCMGSSITYNNPVNISGTSDYLYDLGVITFPAGGNTEFGMFSSVQYSGCSVCAERVGTVLGTLSIDTRFVPIPIDEGCGHIKGTVAGGCEAYCDPLGRIQAFTNGASKTIPDTCGMSPSDCVVPVEKSKIIIAAQNVSSHTATDTVDVYVYAFPRWLSLRGSS